MARVSPRKALEEYCSCYSLQYAARLLGISPKKLKKIIKEHYGWPPNCKVIE